jgi:DMSO/TMAO reductase YedYZ molybdopterin-dependent catalytic subunit
LDRRRPTLRLELDVEDQGVRKAASPPVGDSRERTSFRDLETRRQSPCNSRPVWSSSMSTASRRVQRVASEWPVLHLEPEVPRWGGLVVDGLVREPVSFSLEDLAGLGVEERVVPVHCVWGWSKTGTSWQGIGMGTLLARVGAFGPYTTVRSASDAYSSCLPTGHAAEGMLVWRRGGEELPPEAGGPLRFLPPPRYWAYKGVKWAGRITVGDRFVPGFWEARVSDPVGLVPDDVELP